MRMTLEQFKKATPEELKEYGKTLPEGWILSACGRTLSDKDCYGWMERIYDKDGKIITIHSDGYYSIGTLTEDGDIITYENSRGEFSIRGKEVTEEDFRKFIGEE